MDSLRTGLTTVREILEPLPEPLVALFILCVAIGVALALHRWTRVLLRKLIAVRYPSVFAVVTRMRGLTQLGLLIIALVVAIPVAPLPPETRQFLMRLLGIGIIAYIGWAAITALNIAADLYLRRYRLDVDDNLLARKHNTQVRILVRAIDVVLVILTIAAALMTFQSVRQYGVSLFASAGVAGIVVGLAARPLLSNLLAGVQLAMTQPIRLDDAVIVEGEYGNIEEIRSAYVVVRLWDLRRLVVPLTYFIEKPFQNWTREGSELIGSALLYLDYAAPIGIIRDKAKEIVAASPLWNRKVFAVQITDAKERTIEVRILASSNTAGGTFDIRCDIREKLLAFLQHEHPEALPRERAEVSVKGKPAVHKARSNGRTASKRARQRSRPSANA
jgi:small-conductance mechanosensitive channel